MSYAGTLWKGPLSLLFVAACGLRSSPDIEPVSDDGASGDDGMREGSCALPYEIPGSNVTVRGKLLQGSDASGWCGQDEGPEDHYRITPSSEVDVTFAFRSDETTFEPVVRVTEDGCGDGQGNVVLCGTEADQRAYHVFLRPGHVYDVAIDSPQGTKKQNYAFDVVYGWPPIDACTFHEQAIEQTPGNVFSWENDLSAGQGHADGRCGGPGRENIFLVRLYYSGYIRAYLETSSDFEPILSLRTNCAGISEVACSSWQDFSEGYTELSHYVELAPDQSIPVEYFLAVDQTGHAGGNYRLTVSFE